MIYNIFRKRQRKSRKKITQKKPKIIADIHEKNSLIILEIYESKDVELEIKSLKIADYLIGNIAIERKTTRDFISSMINKRLVIQLQQLKRYKQNMLIIEGNFSEYFNENKKTKLNQNSIRGFILTISLKHQIPIIFTEDSEETAEYLITLAKQILKKPIEPTLHSRIPKSKKEQKQYILESFPNIGPVKAKQLLKNFKTIQRVINADEKELKKILKSKTKDFKELITD